MKQCNGFILLVTMIIIAVISLLILTSMQHILLYYKAINKQELLHRSFYQFEKVAYQLTHSGFSSINRACIVYADSANQIIQNLLHHQGCSLSNSSYYYLIEDLGEFPCLITNHKGRKYATHHQRISVMQMEEGIPSSFLQIRFISVGGTIACFTKEHSIRLGISSWRYFSSIS